MGRMYKSVHVRVVHDLRYMFFVAVLSNDSFNFPLGLIKYIVIVIVIVKWYKSSQRFLSPVFL